MATLLVSVAAPEADFPCSIASTFFWDLSC